MFKALFLKKDRLDEFIIRFFFIGLNLTILFQFYKNRVTSTMQPLAERMRPTSLEDYIGQEKVIGPNAPLRKAIDAGHLPSCILWGPPGVGKTTLATAYFNSVHKDGKKHLHIDGDKWREITQNKDYSKEGRLKNLKGAFDMALYLEKEGFLPILKSPINNACYHS